MSQEDEEIELEFRDPEPVEICEGSALVGDIHSFLAECSALAAMVREGQLWVLREETLSWMKIEDVRKADRAIEKAEARRAAKEEKEPDPPKEGNVTAIRKKTQLTNT